MKSIVGLLAKFTIMQAPRQGVCHYELGWWTWQLPFGLPYAISLQYPSKPHS